MWCVPIICVRTGTVSLPAVSRKVCSLRNCSTGTAVISAGVLDGHGERRAVEPAQIGGRARIIGIEDRKALLGQMIEHLCLRPTDSPANWRDSRDDRGSHWSRRRRRTSPRPRATDPVRGWKPPSPRGCTRWPPCGPAVSPAARAAESCGVAGSTIRPSRYPRVPSTPTR